MKEFRPNFKIIRYGLFINEEYPWLHGTPDFLCSCDCCGEGCGENRCPFCIENCDFHNYVKSSSCLEKDSSGNFILKTQHQYYYQTQQHIFTTKKQYCDLVVCAFNDIKEAKLVVQRICPDKAVLPKVPNFWNTCVTRSAR